MFKRLKKRVRRRLEKRFPVIKRLLPGVRDRDFSVDAGTSNRPDLTGRFCRVPFERFEIYETGRVHLCCSAWLPEIAGRITEAPPEAVWNGETAQKIRASIHDGSFKYCNAKLCPAIQNGTLPTKEQAARDPDLTEIIETEATEVPSGPLMINFCNDMSCNLSCPSCRVEKILYTDGPVFDASKALNDQMIAAFLSKPTERPFTINVTGSGDPFASRIYREMLSNIDGALFPNLRVNIQTNGVMFTPANWRRLERLHSNLDTVLISFDAATADTYGVTRRGGHWETLLKNAAFLAERRAEGLIKHLRHDFVVQKDNYREMPSFVDLSQSLGADVTYFSLLVDWGTWSRGVFLDKAIWRTDHPEFAELLAVLRDPAFDHPHVDLGNLTETRAHAKNLAA